MKKGAPIKDVIIPTGISTGGIRILARKSVNASSNPPIIIVAIIMDLKFFLNNILEIWGTIKPINPMGPTNEIKTPRINDIIIKIIILNLFMFSPFE